MVNRVCHSMRIREVRSWVWSRGREEQLGLHWGVIVARPGSSASKVTGQDVTEWRLATKQLPAFDYSGMKGCQGEASSQHSHCNESLA